MARRRYTKRFIVELTPAQHAALKAAAAEDRTTMADITRDALDTWLAAVAKSASAAATNYPYHPGAQP